MNRILSALLLLALACGGDATAETAQTHTTVGDDTASSGTRPADGVAPEPQAAVRVQLAEIDERFEPRLPDSRFDPGTGQPWVALYGPNGLAVLFDAPAEPGHYDAAGNRVRVTLPGGTTNVPIRGDLDVDAIDPATGRIAATVRGEAVVEGMDVEASIDIDTTITPLP